MAIRFGKEEFTRAAIYKIARDRRFDRETVTRLLIERAKMNADSARRLAGHWMQSFVAHYRHERRTCGVA